MTPPDGHSEDGAALLLAMSFGALTMMVVLALVGRVVGEHRAVARSLAETRAYWAAIGIDTYVLSRTMQMGNCGPDCGQSLLPTQKGYVSEISDLQTWRYPDVGASYQFGLKPVLTQDAVSNAQEMVIRTTFTPPASGLSPAAPDVLALLPAVRPVEFRYCLVANALSPCASGVSKTPPGYQLITSVHRPMN